MTIPSLYSRPAGLLQTFVRVSLYAATFAAAAASVAPASSWAASQQDEDACRPDVFRLCASAIPSEDAIVACLNANLPGLSPACRSVMAPVAPAGSARRRYPAGTSSVPNAGVHS